MNSEPENSQPDLARKIEADKKLDEAGRSRVDQRHGGEPVEFIYPEDIKPDYDTSCEHKRKKLDETETFFDSVICLDCPMVWNYDYGIVRSTMKTLNK